MADIQLIKTEEQYEAALASVEELMDAAPGTPEGDELELRTTLIELYEEEHFPIDLPDPVEAIKFRMEQQGLTQTDLIPHIGSRSKVSEVLSGKRNLTLKMIRALHQHLGIPAEVLIKDKNAGLPLEIKGIDWDKFPLQQMAKLGWIEKAADLKDRAEENMRNLIERAGCLAALPQPHYRKNDQNRVNAKTDIYALQAWCLQVLATARSTKLEGMYEVGTVDLDFMTDLAKLSSLQDGPKLAQEYLSRHGIALVIAKHPPKTHLDGAAMKTIEQTPVIGMTLRYDRLDNFWFCLMHELAHIGRHMDSSLDSLFIDDLKLSESGVEGDEKEREADEWAEEALIPLDAWNASPLPHDPRAENVIALANRLRISPAIVAGRVQFQLRNYRILSNYVGRGEVKEHFPEMVR